MKFIDTMRIMNSKYLASCFLSLVSCFCVAQNKTIDNIAAVVGSNIILQSDIEIQYLQYVSQSNVANESIKCDILDQLLLHKLMINQAQLDSVQVTENQVESELDRRIRYFVTQIGSEQKLEEYYKKSILEIKAEFKQAIREQLLAQTVQSKITKDINASPSDVRAYYETIPKDSLPYINAEVEIAQIVRNAPVSDEEKKSVKEEMEKIRKKITDGADFAAIAALYSQDPGSAKKGGELGFVGRGELVPEFESTAFNLKGSEVSSIIETKYGFHIIQLIERRGEMINVRHILLKPKINPSDLENAKIFLDSVANLIQKKTITFLEAAQKFSDDADTKNNGGLMINPQTGITKFETDQVDPALFFQIDKLKIGEVSSPMLMQAADGKDAYRLLFVRSKTEPHRANLKEDYQKIQTAALNEKQNKAILDWVKKKKSSTYIKVDKAYQNCEILKDWFN